MRTYTRGTFRNGRLRVNEIRFDHSLLPAGPKAPPPDAQFVAMRVTSWTRARVVLHDFRHRYEIRWSPRYGYSSWKRSRLDVPSLVF